MRIWVTGGAHLKKLVRSARSQAADDRVEQATAELAARGPAH